MNSFDSIANNRGKQFGWSTIVYLNTIKKPMVFVRERLQYRRRGGGGWEREDQHCPWRPRPRCADCLPPAGAGTECAVNNDNVMDGGDTNEAPGAIKEKFCIGRTHPPICLCRAAMKRVRRQSIQPKQISRVYRL